MPEILWTWANLDNRAVALIYEAERTLGAGYVLAYRQGDAHDAVPAQVDLQPATLDESQLECLRGLEQLTGCVAVAYGRD
jgi:hypothetical protein